MGSEEKDGFFCPHHFRKLFFISTPCYLHSSHNHVVVLTYIYIETG